MSHVVVGSRVGDITRHGYGDGTYGSNVYGDLNPPVVPIKVHSLERDIQLTLSSSTPVLSTTVAATRLAVAVLTPVLTVQLDELF